MEFKSYGCGPRHEQKKKELPKKNSKVMFQTLKNTVWRSTTLLIVLCMTFGWSEALVGGMTCATYDALSDPRIRLAWQLVWQVFCQQLKTPSPKAHVAKRRMRPPVPRPDDAKKEDTL